VAITFHDTSKRGEIWPCEGPMTAQVQLYDDNMVRILYANAGLKSSEEWECEFYDGQTVCNAICAMSSLPLGVNTSDCSGVRLFENCSVTCPAGYTNTGESPATFSCLVNHSFAGAIGCIPLPCDQTAVPSSWGATGVDTSECDGKVTGENCTVSCQPGYTGDSVAYVCEANGEFDHDFDCAPNQCDISTLSRGAATDSCRNTTTAMGCTAECRAGYVAASAVFSCLANGSFAGNLSCSPVELELGFDGTEGDTTVTTQMAFSVSQNADQLVSELGDPNSAASQTIVTSFTEAMGLPQTTQAVVVSAELQRRLQSLLAVEIEVSGVSGQDASTLISAMVTVDATSAVGAHLEENLHQLDGIDIGSVESVSMRPVTTTTTSGPTTTTTSGPTTTTAVEPPPATTTAVEPPPATTTVVEPLASTTAVEPPATLASTTADLDLPNTTNTSDDESDDETFSLQDESGCQQRGPLLDIVQIFVLLQFCF